MARPSAPPSSTSRRLARVLERPALSIYLPAGYPDPESSAAYLQAALDGGADWLELGIPYSDPVADGPVLQRASTAALDAGATPDTALDLLRGLRERTPDVPLVAMTYAGVAYRHGIAAFARRLAEAGADGLIVPDAPHGEAGEARAACREHGLGWVPLVSPASTDQRIREAGAAATGFLYVVGRLGVTGNSGPGEGAASLLRRVRSLTAAPVVAGFGVRDAGDVASLHAAGAHGVIVGSAVVQRIEEGATPAQVASFVRSLREAPARAAQGGGGAEGPTLRPPAATV